MVQVPFVVHVWDWDPPTSAKSQSYMSNCTPGGNSYFMGWEHEEYCPPGQYDEESQPDQGLKFFHDLNSGYILYNLTAIDRHFNTTGS